MHPILERPGRLALYVAAWIPVGVLLAALIKTADAGSWGGALLLALPLAVFYAFLSLGASFLCRTLPLGRTGASRLLSALVGSDPAAARRMCLLLADFLRRSLGLGGRASVSLREEMALARSFMAIEEVRFGPRLRLEASIAPDTEDCLVPPLVLQPLVE